MAWGILILAGVLEVVWAVGLTFTEGFTRPLPTLVTSVAFVASLTLLGVAVRTLPLGTAYAIWTGIGTVGTVAVGIYLFHDMPIRRGRTEGSTGFAMKACSIPPSLAPGIDGSTSRTPILPPSPRRNSRPGSARSSSRTLRDLTAPGVRRTRPCLPPGCGA